MNIIANLTAKQKAVIRRDFLIDNFKGAYGNNATATLCSIRPPRGISFQEVLER